MTHRLWNIRLQKCRDFENLVKVSSMSLIMSPFDRANMTSYCRYIVTMAQSRIVLRYSMSKNIVTLKSGSEVTQGHQNGHDWSAAYDFLLAFHDNHGSISYRFRDKQRFESKIANFPHLQCILRPRWRDSPWNWVSALGVKKLEWWDNCAFFVSSASEVTTVWRYRNSIIIIIKKFDDSFSRLDRMHEHDRQTDRQTDGRTDRHRATAKTALTHSVEW